MRGGGAAAVLVLAAACAGSSGSGGAAALVPSTDTAAAERPASRTDGVLTIGVLLPDAAEQTDLAATVERAVQVAVGDVEAAGGVLDAPVRLRVVRHGSLLGDAAAALDRLVAEGADAVIGPLSSQVALGLVNRLGAAGVLTCSPGATALELSDVDTGGTFVRTVPSDALQAAALADLVADTGASAVAVLHPDDDYGRNLSRQVADRLAGGGEVEVVPVPYARAGALDGAVAEVTASGALAVAVVGVGTRGAEVLASLAEGGITPTTRRMFVTDGLRSDEIAAQLPAGSLLGITGTSPSPVPVGNVTWRSRWAAVSDGRSEGYAAYAYDCATVTALAARAAGTDDAAGMAVPLRGLTRGGRTCLSFAECVALLGQGLNVDYDGASGPLDLQDCGSPSRATFDVFGFDATGRQVLLRQVVVTAES